VKAGLAALAALLASLVLSYADAPPPAHTGGFGEPTCHACHFDGELDDPRGELEVRVPARYRPGERQLVEVVLRSPGMREAGFQLSARFAEGKGAGRQAGTLESLEGEGTGVMAEGEPAVLYAQHRGAPRRAKGDSVIWRIDWVAPSAGGNVLFHAAANAADGDRSEFGDRIYTAVARAEPR
jgi:hypothetical protein